MLFQSLVTGEFFYFKYATMIHLYPVLKRKATLLTSILALSGASLFAQVGTCGPVVENFTNGAAGFTSSTLNSTAPGFTFATQAGNGFLQRCNIPSPGSVYEITTPTYQVLTGQTTVGYGFELSGLINASNVTVLLQYFDNTGNINTVQVSNAAPTYTGSGNSSISTICQSFNISTFTGFTVGDRYRFVIQVTSAAGSNANQCIVFDNFRTTGGTNAAPLPVTFTSFVARRAGGSIQAIWNVAGERDVLRYEVERSTNGRDFTTVGTVTATGAAAYAFTDNQPVAGVSFYRVRNVDADGKFRYTGIVRVNTSERIAIKAYPQPVRGQLTIEHPVVSGKGSITVTSASGQVIRRLDVKGDDAQTVIDLTSAQAGIYIVRFDNGTGTVEQVKVVKQ